MLINEAIKKIGVLAAVGVLAGCAAGGSGAGVQLNDLRKSRYQVSEQVIGEMDFPTLQRHLFQHRAACGSAPRFIMHEGSTGYASLIETADVPESYENVVVADLIQYPDTLRAPMRVAMTVYSYYRNSDVEKRAENMVNAIRRPGVCPPAEK